MTVLRREALEWTVSGGRAAPLYIKPIVFGDFGWKVIRRAVSSKVIRNRGLFGSFSRPWDRGLLVFRIDFSWTKLAVQQLYLFFCKTKQKILPNHKGVAARAAMNAEYLGDKKTAPAKMTRRAVSSRVIRNRGCLVLFSRPWDRVLLVFRIDS